MHPPAEATCRTNAPTTASVRNRLVAAIALAAVIPGLVLAFVVQRYALPVAGRHDVSLSVLALATTIAMATGGWVLWDIARRVSRFADLVAEWQPQRPIRCRDDLSRLAGYVSDVVATVQDQAHEIEALHLRLLTVQNDLGTAREKLRASSIAPAGWDVFTSQLDIRTRPELVAS